MFIIGCLWSNWEVLETFYKPAYEFAVTVKLTGFGWVA